MSNDTMARKDGERVKNFNWNLEIYHWKFISNWQQRDGISGKATICHLFTFDWNFMASKLWYNAEGHACHAKASWRKKRKRFQNVWGSKLNLRLHKIFEIWFGLHTLEGLFIKYVLLAVRILIRLSNSIEPRRKIPSCRVKNQPS